ncbi:MAG: tetratricopeptide repeat protein [Polaromonas sp.]
MTRKPVTADKYSRLVRPLTFLVALLGLIAAFIGLFPSQQRLSALSRQRESDALSIAYLQLLLRTHPDDDALRRAVAHNLASAGKWDQARSILHPLLGQANESGQRMRMDALEIEFLLLQTLPKDSPERTVVMGNIVRLIESLRREIMGRDTMVRLAEISLAMTLPNLSAQIYYQLAAIDPDKRQSWLELAATHYLGSNAPDRAARVYEEAALNAVNDLPSYRKYTLLALDAYLSANFGALALLLVEASASRLDNDPEFMRRAVAVALAQNDVAASQRLGRQLVTVLPDDAAVLSQQIELELAVKDLPAALVLASRLVKLDPIHFENRIRLARIAEWAGKQDIALEQWTLLARGAPASEAMDNALRLALARQNDGLWLELATQVVQKRPLKPQESASLAAIQMRHTASKQLIAFLNEYRKRHALQLDQWATLANALEQQGDLPAALAAWQEMSPQLISPAESARRQAELLLRVKRPGDAWAVLMNARTHATPSDTAYWQAFGDLAWDHELKSEALLAYRTVWEAGSFNVRAMERLIQLYNASAEPKHAIAVGTQAYQRLAEARWLLLAMDAASQASLWDELRDLSRLAQHDEGKFSKSEMYWLLEAQIASHDQHKPRARTAYYRALALNPVSVPTRVQLLWFEIDGGNNQQLDDYLRQWQTDAQADPAYWAAYAIALLQLKKANESLVWFDRQAHAKPDDDLWSLSYAQALEQAGQTDAAQRLRGRLLPRLTAKLASTDRTPKPSDKRLLLAYALISREFEGAAAGDQVLQQMLKRGYNDADVYELLVASSLSQEKFDKAHYWLLRAEVAHHKLPAYQLLAVALENNDRPALEQILLLRKKELSSADQVTALRRLGRNKLALSLTERSLLEADAESSERLRQHRDQLRVQLSRRIEAGYEARNLTDLKIKRSEVGVSFPFDSGRATVRLAHNGLRSDSDTLKRIDGLNENDLSLLAEVTFGNDPLRFTLGRNQRADKSLTYGRFELTHALNKRLNARLDVSVNSLTEETSALRAIGSKDKVALGLSGNPTDLTYARLELAGQRFNTRTGDRLGKGYRLEGEIGATLSRNTPTLEMRLSGSSERNRLADRLPASLTSSVLSPSQSVESVLPPRFSTLGVGATYRYGPTDGVEHRPQGVLDGWVGRQWPANELAYSVRAGMTLPVLSAGQVRLEGFYTNVQGGLSAQANRGVSVLYRQEF